MTSFNLHKKFDRTYLIDCKNKLINDLNFVQYALYVTFFPQLIAGPIVLYSDIVPQFSRPFRFDLERFHKGAGLFFVGLFKKLIIADSFAVFVKPTFEAAKTSEINFLEAWTATLSYTFQIYFDFSGYSDMAIGLGLLFGICIPINFLSPYRSRSIIEFWRRWHITLGNCLRDFLYIPMGGNRNGSPRKELNLLATMLLGGIWHGAGWTFVVWGGMHGIYLCVNHLYRKLTSTLKISLDSKWIYRLFYRPLTFFSVVIAWVYFRATDLRVANKIMASMLGFNGIVLPTSYESWVPTLIKNQFNSFITFGSVERYTGKSLVCALGVICIFVVVANNSVEYFGYQFSTKKNTSQLPSKIIWQPSIPHALVLGIITVIGIVSIFEIHEFIYFQF